MSYNRSSYTPSPYSTSNVNSQLGKTVAQARGYYSGPSATAAYGSYPAAQNAHQRVLNSYPQGLTRSGVVNYNAYRGGIYHKRKTHKRKTHKRKTHKRKTRRSK
jgi:hypothetical protein